MHKSVLSAVNTERMPERRSVRSSRDAGYRISAAGIHARDRIGSKRSNAQPARFSG